MWFPARYSELGKIDISAVEAAVRALPEAVWHAEDALKQKVAGNRQTNSIFFCSIEKDDFTRIVGERAIEAADVKQRQVPEDLREKIEPLIAFALQHCEPGGVLVRAQLARMKPGTCIEPHIDRSPLLIATQRLHIPIITNQKVKFMVGGEQVKMLPGQLYELNNQVLHSVENPADAQARTHLIVDYLPAFANTPAAVGKEFGFRVRRYRSQQKPQAAKSAKASATLALPKLIATSVVRGANKSESHGGVYIVDMQSRSFEQVVDWNTCDIDLEGRGWDRGLRGICFHENDVLIAGSDAIYRYSSSFEFLTQYTNPYLRHAHEMGIDGRYLYVSSTGFDAVLRFDLKKKRFDKGWQLQANPAQSLACVEFDPSQPSAVQASNQFHINNTWHQGGILYLSGRGLPGLVAIEKGKSKFLMELPLGTHNVQRAGKGYVYNDTESDQVVYSNDYEFRCIDVPKYDNREIINAGRTDDKLARQGFARGLCLYRNGIVFSGSSPSTISAYDLKTSSVVASFQIDSDICNAIHGLEIWPF